MATHEFLQLALYNSTATMRMVNIARNLPLLTEITLLALFVWLLSGWLLTSDQHGLSNIAGKVDPLSKAQPDLSALLAAPLFGKLEAQSVPAVTQQTAEVLKPLNIRLIGTVAAGDRSAAIISLGANSEQKTVFVGGDIQPGVKLFHVDAEAIVVVRSGRRQLISLHRDVLQGAVISEERASEADVSRVAVPTGRASTQPSPTSDVFSKKRRQALPKRARPRSPVRGISRLLTQADFTPHLSAGKQDGLLISNIVFGSLFQQAGLYNGDVIRAVNGQLFNDAKKDSMQLLKILHGSNTIDFEITRAGKVLNVHYIAAK